VLKVTGDDPDFLGKTGHRHGQGGRNQSSSQHTQDLHLPLIGLRPSIEYDLVGSYSTVATAIRAAGQALGQGQEPAAFQLWTVRSAMDRQI
jgi:hypothetical protein